ncbi:unnamed protein product, partial [Rotaria sp. Silwood1]
TDEYDTDVGTGIFLTKSNRSQVDSSTIIDQNQNVKRTSSLVSFQHNELNKKSSDRIMSNTILSSSSPTSQYVTQKRLQNINRIQQQNNKSLNKIENDQISNISPSIITMPHLMEFTRRLSRSSSINDNDTTTNDSNTIKSLSKYDTSVLRRNLSINNSNTNLKKTYLQKQNNLIVKQSLNSIDYIIKERSISSLQDNYHQNQSNANDRLNQILKKQFFLPFEKNK